jgi:hypothetical protein
MLCAVGLLLPLLHRRRHVGAHRRKAEAGRHAGERRPPGRAPRRSWLAPTLPLPLVEPRDGPTTVGLPALAPPADPWFNEALTIFLPTLILPSLCDACPQHN